MVQMDAAPVSTAAVASSGPLVGASMVGVIFRKIVERGTPSQKRRRQALLALGMPPPRPARPLCRRTAWSSPVVQWLLGRS